jgi:hypothetical protein
MHASVQVPSIEEAAIAMCKTRETKRKSKEKEREENKNYISTYTVAFRECIDCSMWSMQFRGIGKGRPFGGWNTLVELRKNFHARVREKEKEKDFLLRQKEGDGIQSFTDMAGDDIESGQLHEQHGSLSNSTNTARCRGSEVESDCVSGERYRNAIGRFFPFLFSVFLS